MKRIEAHRVKPIPALHKRRDDVPESLEAAYQRMMAKDPRRRYQTPDDLLDDLDVLIEALKDGSRELANLIGMTWKDSQRSRIPRLLSPYPD